MTRAPKGRRRDTTRRSGVIALLIGGVLLYWAFVHHLPFLASSVGPTVRANFAEASNLNPRTPVRIDGVDVGKVIGLAPGDGGRSTIVTMSVGRWGAALHSDATAQIRMRTIVSGAMYIDLHPGSTAAPALGVQVIPLSATSTQVDYDQFTSIAQPIVRLQERQVIKGLDRSLAAPAGIRRTLGVAPSALQQIGTAADALRGEDLGDLPQLIVNSEQALRAISSDGPSLGNFVAGAERTFAATADQSQALGATLADTPPALRSTQATMSSLNGTLGRLDTLAEQLIPGASRLAPATSALRPALRFTDALLVKLPPLLRVAPPALAALRGAGQLGSRVLAGANPIVARFNDSVLPWLDTVDPVTGLRVYESVGPTIATLDSAESDFDATGYFIRYDTAAAANSVLLPCDVGPGGADAETCVVDLPSGLLSDIRRREGR